MKYWALATLVSSGLAVVLASLGLLVTTNVSYTRARFPGLQPVGESHFALLSALTGRVSESGTYRTPANLATVQDWYEGRFGAESPADDTVNVRAGCSTVMKSEQWIFFRRTFQATLCSRPPGTSVYLYQTVYLSR